MSSSAEPSKPKSQVMGKIVCLHSSDNAVVATASLGVGESLSVGSVTIATRAAIPAGHKVAVSAIASGKPVVKYGCPIGVATCDIQPGDHVHSHNLADTMWCPVI